jgi:ribosome biogenesis GTPase
MDLSLFGWNDYFASQCPEGWVARIALAARERFTVWTERGEIEASISGRLRHNTATWPCVGDWVVLRDDSVITGILPRRTEVIRKQPGKEVREQVLAANVDVLFVVSGLDSDYNPRRLERYLILAHESRARPVVLLNKADLSSDIPAVVSETEALAPGVSVIAVSALKGWGLEALPKLLEGGETAALIGSSGAGKSTILNRLLGEERQRTTSVCESDNRGRHTTTRRELILMPQGWLLMDLPGLRELQLWADPEQIDQTFAEITALAGQCRFRDCSHRHEPGCAVRSSELDEHRLENYHKLQRELAYLDRQADPHLARETRKRWNTIEKAMRRHPKR